MIIVTLVLKLSCKTLSSFVAYLRYLNVKFFGCSAVSHASTAVYCGEEEYAGVEGEVGCVNLSLLVYHLCGIARYSAATVQLPARSAVSHRGLRLGERVVAEVQRLQRRQCSNRVGKFHELAVVEEQRRQIRELDDRFRNYWNS